jgi:ubiquinone/menaquinone biosynthesis C-methylase UbiE
MEQRIPIIKLARFTWIRNQCSNSDKIIDIGCNRGETFNSFNRKNIVSVDIDDYSNLVENFVRADAHYLPFKDEEFDIAVLGEILEHVENPVQVLKEAKRVAKKILITVPNEYEWPPELNPFMPAEEAARKQGLTLEEMVKKDNPAKEHYSIDGYKHIFHNRYYTYEMLENHLKEAGIRNYKISKLIHDKYIFWVAICD